MKTVFAVALTVGLIALASAGVLYAHFKRKFKDKLGRNRN